MKGKSTPAQCIDILSKLGWSVQQDEAKNLLWAERLHTKVAILTVFRPAVLSSVTIKDTQQIMLRKRSLSAIVHNLKVNPSLEHEAVDRDVTLIHIRDLHSFGRLIGVDRFDESAEGNSTELIDFTAGGNSGQFVRSGISFQEPNGRWTIGEASEIVVPLREFGRDYVLHMTVAPAQSGRNERNQRLKCYFNGTLIRSFHLRSTRTINLPISRNVLRPEGVNVLRLEHPDCASPADFSTSRDQRKVAFSVSRILVAPRRPIDIT